MTEPSPLAKAEAAVTEAETNTVAVQLALAAVELAKTAAAQQQASQQQGCHHQHKEPVNVGKWVGIGLAVCVGSVGLALGFLAVAIAAPCATACLIVLRSMWREYMGHK